MAKLTYNAALTKRLTRGTLMEKVGVPEQPRWDLKQLTRKQMNEIFNLGGLDARFIVN